jgi:DNA invertase Pin-like site-specific DNA recombinase
MRNSKSPIKKILRFAPESHLASKTRSKTSPVLAPPTRRAVIYNRVASVEGSQDHLAMYLKVCRQYAESQGFEIVGEYADIGSGLELDRPGLNTVRQVVAQNLTDVVIIYEFHCLTRSAGHALALLNELGFHGVRLYSAYRQMEVTA